jgi:hypothetical protein
MIVAGGWSALINREASGLDAHQTSRRLLDQEVAPMRTTPWGEPVAPTYLRLVLSNQDRGIAVRSRSPRSPRRSN